MASALAGLMFEEAVEKTLREIGAIGPDGMVRTSALAKAMRRLGFALRPEVIAEKLFRHRNALWARRLSIYIGGTNDETDTLGWAIPKGEA